MCSAQYGCFLEFLDFMFPWYVAHVFSKWLWNSPIRPYYYWYHLCFFTFHMHCISVVRSLYFRIFSSSFLIAFQSPEIAPSININAPFSLSQIIMSGLLLGIVLSVCTCWFQNMVTLPPWLVSPNCYYYYYHHHRRRRRRCCYNASLDSGVWLSLNFLEAEVFH